MNLGLSLISRFETFGRMDCLGEAISLHRAALRLCPRGHPRRQKSLSGLAIAMHLRYLRTHRMEDLEESIDLKRENLALTPSGHPMRLQMLYNLSLSLQTQYTWTGNMSRIEEGIDHLYEASKLVKSGYPNSRRILNFFLRGICSNGLGTVAQTKKWPTQSNNSELPSPQSPKDIEKSPPCLVTLPVACTFFFPGLAMQSISKSPWRCIDLPSNPHSLVRLID